MIEVKNVTKLYVSKNKKETKALDDVSFVLPDKGFVYALGKSGSGKSTLLNILGLLDSPTNGEILIDGKSIKDFSKEDIDYYRSSYCGFIFQDYQLLNELAVKDNIALSLDIKDDSERKEERLDSLMKDLGIEEYANKYPYELSGGQKQRVGIARALIKKPKMILCDEPTGNLDKETTQTILSILKKSSQDCLVFMVSHDYDSSIFYADRRITIASGKIEKDEIRKEGYFNEFKIIGKTAYIPFLKKVSKEELELLRDKAKAGEIDEIIQIDQGFIPYENRKEEIKTPFEAKTYALNRDRKKDLCKKYIATSKKTSVFQTIGHSLLITLFILIQSFVSFTPSKLYFDNNDYTDRRYALVSSLDTAGEGYDEFSYFKSLEKEENDGLFEEAESYEVINHTISFDSSKFAYMTEMNRITNDVQKYINAHGFYSSCTLGTAIVTEDFLKKTFYNGGELEVLSGSLEGLNDENCEKLVITDYSADSILDTYYGIKDYTYDDLIGNYKAYSSNLGTINGFSNASIGAIIKTDYKERYADLVEKYEKLKADGFPSAEMADFASSDEFTDYYAQIYNGELSLSFSLNPSFYDLVKNGSNKARQMVYLGGLFISLDATPSTDDRQFSISDRYNYSNNQKLDPKYDNEYAISITKDFYDKLCVKANKQSIIGDTIYIVKTSDQSVDGAIEEIVPLKVVGRSNSSSIINEKTLAKLKSIQTMKIGKLIPIYDKNSMYTLQKSVNNGLSLWNMDNSVYQLIDKTLNVFHSLFFAIEMVIAAVLIGWILLSSMLNIKKNKYQIGVYKSLGMNDNDIMALFLSKNLILGGSSLLLTSLLAAPFFSLSNYLVTKSYASFMEIKLKYFNIFYFHFGIFVLVYFAVILLFALFTLLPMLMLKKITPARIVNNKADD